MSKIKRPPFKEKEETANLSDASTKPVKENGTEESPNNKNKIAIIGGGIAGLYTAWRISRESGEYDITIFECRELGGRIRSQDLDIGFKAELGAMRFRRSHKLLNYLIDELAIDICDFEFNPPKYYVRGRRLDSTELVSGRCSHCQASIPFILKEDERNLSPVELIKRAIWNALKHLSFPNLTGRNAKKIKAAISQEKLNSAEWRTVKQEGAFNHIPLYGIGFWNLLQHFLSNEAYIFVHEGLSLESTVGNWNAAEAIPWFLSDFASDDYKMIIGGSSKLIEELEKALTNNLVEKVKNKTSSDELIEKLEKALTGSGELVEELKTALTEKDALSELVEELENALKDKKTLKGKVTVKSQRKVEKIILSGDEWRLKFQNAEPDETFDKIILALPKKPLEEIKIEMEGKADWKPEWIKWVRGHRLFKLFLLFESVWWMGDAMPGHASGRVLTDLPLRHIFYFSSNWMSEHSRHENEEKTENGRGLIMASYSDEHYVTFWEPLLSSGHEEKGLKHFSVPYLKRTHNVSDEFWKYLQDLSNSKPQIFASERMIDKVMQMLREIHGREENIPDPILGVFTDWGEAPFGAGWHTWEVGSRPWEVEEKITSPFGKNNKLVEKLEKALNGSTYLLEEVKTALENKNSSPELIEKIRIALKGNKEDSKELIEELKRELANPPLENLFICGEAYSYEQGWIEGALKTSELVLERLKIQSPSKISDYKNYIRN